MILTRQTYQVILTRQTCGQRSSGAAESKRRAPGNYFPDWICYIFLLSKCRWDWGLGLCTFWVLAKREPLRNGNFRNKTCFARTKNRNLALRSGSLFASTQKLHRPRSHSPLQFDIKNILQIYAQMQFPVLGVCFLQTRSRAGRRFAVSRSCWQNYQWILSFSQQNCQWDAL